jgi:hypothetical protein
MISTKPGLTNGCFSIPGNRDSDSNVTEESDLDEDFDFCDLEIQRTRANDIPVQSGVVGVTVAKPSGTAGVCVAVIGNNNVIKAWTISGATIDCLVLHFGFQRKSLRRDYRG